MDSSATPSLLSPASWGRLARLAQKELRETLRDRRTLGTLVLMPLLVYPLLNVAFQKLLLSEGAAAGPPAYHVGMESEDEAVVFRGYLDWGSQILAEEEQSQTPPAPGSAAAAGVDEHPPEIAFSVGPQLEQHVRDLDLDLAVRMEVGPAPKGSWPGPIDAQLLYRRGSPSSEAALRYVEERLRAVNERWLADQLGAGRVRPAHFLREAIITENTSAFSLATLAPLILILMTVTGAVYPAIDLTAGERERNTLETLIAAPIPRMSLLLAKYIAVLTVALLTAMVNFLAMTLTIVGGGLGPFLFGPGGLRLGTALQVFGLTILFAAFFAAVLLAVTSFARSFKEAQAYLIPLTLVSLAPGFLAFTPGLELNGALALAPLANIVLVARDMLQGDVDPWWTIVAVFSTAVYAIAALAVAARVFGADALLFGADDSWTAWFIRPRVPRAAAPLANAVICLAILLPCYLLLAGGLAQLRGTPLATRLLATALVTSLLFGLIPLAAAAIGRVSLRPGFALRPAPVWAWLGAAVLGFSLWPFAHEIFLLNRWLGWVSLDDAHLEPAMRLIEQLPTTPLWLVLASLAIAPAVFEEFFFRGYFFTAVRARSAAVQTILITAVLFGAFHVFSSVLAIERMLPSTLLGLALGWVRWRSGSVLPCMLLHAAHNGFLITLAYHRDELVVRGWGVQDESHLPPTWLAAAAVAAALGAGFVSLAGRGKRAKPQA